MRRPFALVASRALGLRAFGLCAFGLIALGCSSPAPTPLSGGLSPQHSGGGQKWAHYWARTDNAERDRDPATALILGAVAARPGQWVADIGAGAGFFAAKLARVVGPSGRAVATEIDPDMVASLRAYAQARGLQNLDARLVAEADVGIEPGRYDTLLLVNVHVFWKGAEAFADGLLGQYALALRPGGRLVIYQDNLFTGTNGSEGRFYGHTVSLTPAELAAQARPRGLVQDKVVQTPNAVGPGQRPGFLLVLRREEAQPSAL